MESEGVSLTLIHEHLMMPWNELIPRRGDCCGRFIKDISDGYYCKTCDVFVHKECGESSKYIQHPSHSIHTLQLRRLEGRYCDLCGWITKDLVYHCEICKFDVDLYCAKYPPPDVIDISEAHHHKLTLLKERTQFKCDDAKCGKTAIAFPYNCHECDLSFHVDCVWNVQHFRLVLFMESEGVSLPLIHEHLMMPWNDLMNPRRGDCCGRFIKDYSDGYYCKTCDFLVHKECAESSEYIEHPSHNNHTLQLRRIGNRRCNVCGWEINRLGYRCEIGQFNVDLYCAKYPPPVVIDNFEIHHHKLILLKELIEFDCGAKCGKSGGDTFPYECYKCDLYFHVECVWHPSEVKHPLQVNHPLEINHSYHSLHPLKLLTDGLPDYSDGKCRLCERKVDDKLFYHCSSCNFTLDLRCVKHPPQQSLLDLKTHDHQLTLLPKLISFTCNACGLKGDRSPYLCVQCEYTIHQDCLDLPRLININRHDHRLSRTSLLGVVNSVCGVCRQKVDWTCGGYSCQRCPGYVVHSKCATRRDVWNGKELEGVPEETEDIEPYVVIDDNTIQHFSHEEHHLRLHVHGSLFDDNKRCNACTHPVSLQSFYSCMACDFTLHQICAEFPRKKRHVLHNEQLTLVTDDDIFFRCTACLRLSNGFRYEHGNKIMDLQCSSISEPIVHPSHPHPLYHFSPDEEAKSCNGCNKCTYRVLGCIEKNCGFVLGFECATLPQVIKHRVDDHPLSLCYGEEASGKYWCDICEKETNPKTWFYTCKDHRASLHTQCVLGNFSNLMPGSTNGNFEVVLNNSVSRPFCYNCRSRCIFPIIIILPTYFWPPEASYALCSYGCLAEVSG